MIENILVPTDGSEHAVKAVEMAADLAGKYGARLVILHVRLRHASVSEVEALLEGKSVPDELMKRIEASREAALEAASHAYEGGLLFMTLPDDVLDEVGGVIVDNAKTAAEAAGVSNVSTEIVNGDPADMIVAAAEHEKSDMIVMGSRGLGNVSGLLMGSVSQKVLQRTECTCVTVK